MFRQKVAKMFIPYNAPPWWKRSSSFHFISFQKSLSTATVPPMESSADFERVATAKGNPKDWKEYHLSNNAISILPHLIPTNITTNMHDKSALNHRLYHLQQLLCEAQSSIKDCTQSDILAVEEELKEARDAVKELYFEFMETVDDLDSLTSSAMGSNRANLIVQQVKRRLNGIERVIHICNVWQLQVIMSHFSESYAKLHGILSKEF